MAARSIKRQRAWEEIRRRHRQRRHWTVADLARVAELSLNSAREFNRSLIAAGFVAEAGIGPDGNTRHYQLIQDPGPSAPCVRTDGTGYHVGQRLERLWRAIKILGEFGIRDLVFAASTPDAPVSEAHARYYVTRLAQAGYLVRARRRYRAVPGRCVGDLHPMISGRSVVDRNTGKTYPIGGPGHEHE